MKKVQMSMSKDGQKLLNRGISPTLTEWDEEYMTDNDILVEVDKNQLVSNGDDTFEVRNIKSIKVIQNMVVGNGMGGGRLI